MGGPVLLHSLAGEEPVERGRSLVGATQAARPKSCERWACWATESQSCATAVNADSTKIGN